MKKKIFAYIAMAIVFTGIGAFAATIITAEEVSYGQTTVKDGLDDLYTKAKPLYTGPTAITPSTTSQVLNTKDTILTEDITIDSISSVIASDYVKTAISWKSTNTLSSTYTKHDKTETLIFAISYGGGRQVTYTIDLDSETITAKDMTTGNAVSCSYNTFITDITGNTVSYTLPGISGAAYRTTIIDIYTED